MIKAYIKPSLKIRNSIKKACKNYMKFNDMDSFEYEKESITNDFLKEMNIVNPTRSDKVDARSAIEFRAKRILDELIAEKYDKLKTAEAVIDTMKECDEIKENFRRSQR